jgi:hypothetical protein
MYSAPPDDARAVEVAIMHGDKVLRPFGGIKEAEKSLPSMPDRALRV